MNIDNIVNDSIKELNEQSESQVRHEVKQAIQNIVSRQGQIETLLEEIKEFKLGIKKISQKTVSDDILK